MPWPVSKLIFWPQTRRESHWLYYMRSWLGQACAWLICEWIVKIREGPTYYTLLVNSEVVSRHIGDAKDPRESKSQNRQNNEIWMCSPSHTQLNWQNTWLDVFALNLCPIIGWTLSSADRNLKIMKKYLRHECHVVREKNFTDLPYRCAKQWEKEQWQQSSWGKSRIWSCYNIVMKMSSFPIIATTKLQCIIIKESMTQNWEQK